MPEQTVSTWATAGTHRLGESILAPVRMSECEIAALDLKVSRLSTLSDNICYLFSSPTVKAVFKNSGPSPQQRLPIVETIIG